MLKDNIKIAVGGMIGVGKSTLTDKLAEALKIDKMQEFEADDEVFHTLLRWLYEGRPNVEMLLQIYFLHSHWLRQTEVGNNSVIIDRDITEHWLFAQKNLKAYPKVMNMYNGLFHQYINDWKKPDLYIILDLSWDEFRQRIFTRGRQSEIDNFNENEDYFKNLIEDYTKLLIAQCTIHDINFCVINTNNKTQDEVLKEAIAVINNELW